MSDDSFTAPPKAGMAGRRPVEDKWPEAQLAALFEARFEEGIAPALAAEVTRPGRPPVRVLRGAAADDDHPPGEQTAFRIASCTKSFTAAAALVLRRSGRLDLDTDIREWLPELRFTGAFAADRPVAVRHLLTMSSGLPEDDPWADRQESMPVEQFDALLAGGIRLASAPGERFRYSNLGYALLGRILERASGTNYRAVVSDNLLRPLELEDTAFAASDLQVPAARGYRRTPAGSWHLLPFTEPGSFSPIGGLFSTLQDLRRWATWLAAGPAYTAGDAAAASSTDDAQASRPYAGPLSTVRAPAEPLDAGPLTLAERAEMQQIHRPVPLRTGDPPGTRRGYGFGLNILEHPDAGRIVYHSGGYPGFSAQMRWHPGTGTIALGLENATYSRIGEAVSRAMDTALGIGPKAPADEPAAQPPSAGPEHGSDTAFWPELQAARAALCDWLSSPTPEYEETLRTFFSPNMDQDQPWEERRAVWLQLRAQAAPLHPEDARLNGGDGPAELCWIVPCAHADLCCAAQLNPVEPPRVQRLDITVLPRRSS